MRLGKTENAEFGGELNQQGGRKCLENNELARAGK